MLPTHENGNPAARQIVALRALAWVLSDDDRARRLLALTGLDPAELRRRAASPELGTAVLDFVAAHEPDLIACAEALDMAPRDLAAMAGNVA